MESQVEKLLTVLMQKVIDGIPNGKGGFVEQPIEHEAQTFLTASNQVPDAAVAAAAFKLLMSDSTWGQTIWKNAMVAVVGTLPIVGGATASFYPQFELLWKQLRFIALAAHIYGHDVRAENTKCQVVLCLVDEKISNGKFMPSKADSFSYIVRVVANSLVRKFASKAAARALVGVALDGLLIGVVPGVVSMVNDAIFGARLSFEEKAKAAKELVTRVKSHFKNDDHSTLFGVAILLACWLLPNIFKQLNNLDRVVVKLLAGHHFGVRVVVMALLLGASGGLLYVSSGPLKRLAKSEPWLVSSTVLFIRTFLYFASAQSVAESLMKFLYYNDWYFGHKFFIGMYSMLSRNWLDLKPHVPHVQGSFLVWILWNFVMLVVVYSGWEFAFMGDPVVEWVRRQAERHFQAADWFPGMHQMRDALDIVSTLAMHKLVDEIRRPEIMVKLLGPREVVGGLVFAARRLGAMIAKPKDLLDWLDKASPSPTTSCLLVAGRMTAIPLGAIWGVTSFWNISSFGVRLLFSYAVLVSMAWLLWQSQLPEPLEHKVWSEVLTTRHRLLYLIPDLQPKVLKKLYAAVEYFEGYEKAVYHTSVSISSTKHWAMSVWLNSRVGRWYNGGGPPPEADKQYEVVSHDDIVSGNSKVAAQDAIWNDPEESNAGIASGTTKTWVEYVRGFPAWLRREEEDVILQAEEEIRLASSHDESVAVKADAELMFEDDEQPKVGRVARVWRYVSGKLGKDVGEGDVGEGEGAVGEGEGVLGEGEGAVGEGEGAVGEGEGDVDDGEGDVDDGEGDVGDGEGGANPVKQPGSSEVNKQQGSQESREEVAKSSGDKIKPTDDAPGWKDRLLRRLSSQGNSNPFVGIDGTLDLATLGGDDNGDSVEDAKQEKVKEDESTLASEDEPQEDLDVSGLEEALPDSTGAVSEEADNSDSADGEKPGWVRASLSKIGLLRVNSQPQATVRGDDEEVVGEQGDEEVEQGDEEVEHGDGVVDQCDGVVDQGDTPQAINMHEPTNSSTNMNDENTTPAMEQRSKVLREVANDIVLQALESSIDSLAHQHDAAREGNTETVETPLANAPAPQPESTNAGRKKSQYQVRGRKRAWLKNLIWRDDTNKRANLEWFQWAGGKVLSPETVIDITKQPSPEQRGWLQWVVPRVGATTPGEEATEETTATQEPEKKNANFGQPSLEASASGEVRRGDLRWFVHMGGRVVDGTTVVDQGTGSSSSGSGVASPGGFRWAFWRRQSSEEEPIEACEQKDKATKGECEQDERNAELEWFKYLGGRVDHSQRVKLPLSCTPTVGQTRSSSWLGRFIGK